LFAVIVAIDKYRKIKRLHYAVHDARALQSVLETCYAYQPENILAITDDEVTSGSLKDAVANWLPSRNIERQDNVIFFFSGHCQTKDGDDFIATVESGKDPRRDWMPVSYIFDELGKLHGNRLVILDSGYSGRSFGQTAATALARPSSPQDPTAFVGISAGRQSPITDLWFLPPDSVEEQHLIDHSLLIRSLTQVLECGLGSMRLSRAFSFQDVAERVQRDASCAILDAVSFRETGKDEANEYRPEWGTIGNGTREFIFEPSKVIPDIINQLIESIEFHASPISWRRVGGPGTIRAEGPTLVVSASSDVQEEVQGYLSQVRQALSIPFRSIPRVGVGEEWDREVRAILAESTAVDFVETPLSKALAALGQKHLIGITVDEDELRKVGLDGQLPVTVRTAGLSLAETLNVLVRQLALTYEVSEGGILVTTLEASEGLLEERRFAIDDIIEAASSSVNLGPWAMGLDGGEWYAGDPVGFPAEQTGNYRNTFGIFIGIDEYQHMGDLRCAATDARELRRILLERYGYEGDETTLLTNQDGSEKAIRSCFSSWLRSRNPGRSDSVLVFFSGHGLVREGQSYLAASDSDPASLSGGIPFSFIVDELRKEDTNCAVILDCCFSGNVFRSVGDSLKGVVFESGKTGLVGMSSGRDSSVLERVRAGSNMGKQAAGISPFTWVLIEELEKSKAAVLPFTSLAVRVSQRFDDYSEAFYHGSLETFSETRAQKPDWGTISSGSTSFFFKNSRPELVPIARLIGLIVETVRPKEWDAQGGPGSIEVLGSLLVVEASKGVHDDLTQFLERLRGECSLKIPAMPGRPRWAMRYEKSVEERVTVKFFRKRLWEVVEELGAYSPWCGINLESTALEEVGIDEGTLVTLRADDVPLRDVLAQLCDQLGVTFVVDNFGVSITTRDSIGSATEARIYNVADLVAVIQQGSKEQVFRELQDHSVDESRGQGGP
jgi:hypothetical protein